MRSIELEQREPRGIHLRSDVSFVLRSLALWGVVGSAVQYVLMWWSAYRIGVIPRAWNDGFGNHGPWRHLHFLRLGSGSGMWRPDILFHTVLLTLAASVPIATLALVLAPSWKRVRLFVLCFGLLALYFHTHYWLVD
jgi:hypothetical protein